MLNNSKVQCQKVPKADQSGIYIDLAVLALRIRDLHQYLEKMLPEITYNIGAQHKVLFNMTQELLFLT